MVGQYLPPDNTRGDYRDGPDGVSRYISGSHLGLSYWLSRGAEHHSVSLRLSWNPHRPECFAAGTLALFIPTTTVPGKLLLESVENIDEGVVEAIRATGAGYTQTLTFAVHPQVLPDLISFTLYRLETNIRAASVLGLIGTAVSGI